MPPRKLPFLFAASVAAFATTSVAQSIVVPAGYASSRGSSGANTLTRDAGQPRTYQIGIDTAELGGIPPGAVLTGISFRCNVSSSNAPSWPPVDATWADYEVSIGSAVPIASWSTTFASNFASAPVLVRQGPMTIPAGTYSNNVALPAPQPNAWGEFYWDFQTPWVYPGGDLAILFTHTGSNLTGSFAYFDYQTVASTVTAYTASSFRATTGTRILSPAIARIHYGHGAPCANLVGQSPLLVQDADLAAGLGGTIRLSVGNGPAFAGALYVFGFGRLQIPLPNGCSLWLVPGSTLFVLLDPLGRARVPVTVPPGVLGTFEAQTLVLDAAGPAGFTATNAVSPSAR